jgi:hypothetical protein
LNLIAAIVFTMSVSVYAPDAGGINGGGLMADGNEPRFGYAACGPQFPFGTIFEITADIDMGSFQLPQVVECRDRGSMIGRHNLDLVIRTGNVNEDLAIAREFGRRPLQVRVWPGWNTWHETRLAAGRAMLRLPRRPGTNPAESHPPPKLISTALRTRRSQV